MIDKFPLIRRLRYGAYFVAIAALTSTAVQAQTSFGTVNSVLGAASGSGITSQGTSGGSGMDSTSGTTDSLGSTSSGQGLDGSQLDSGPNSLGRANQLGNGRTDASSRQSQSKAGVNSDGRETELGASARGPARVPEQPSQFQMFVQQATGRLLPMYGRELFEQPQIYAADATGPAPDDYVLGPGDDVRVQVWGGVNYDGTLTIDRNGQVNIPRAGVVTLAGVRRKDVESVLRNQLGNTFTNFNLNANLDRLRSMQVYVVGQAKQPGTYNLSSLSTLVNAVFASGGPSSNGSMRNIQLKRAGKVVSTFDLYDFIGKGDKSHDVGLQPGDVIVIPPVGPRVALTGALDRAAIYELKSGTDGATSLGELLTLNGGVPVLATTQKALVERVIPGQNPPRQVQDLTLDAAGLQKPLLDGDIVTLLSISPAFGNAVTLQGNVAAPLRYRWFPGMKIRDLIPERDALITPNYYQRKNLLVQSVDSNVQDPKAAGSNVTDRVRGIVDQINWDYAVVERMDRDRLKTQLIPFNLAGAVLRGDESQNLALEAGDVVTILSDKDLRLPIERQNRLVRLEGEVAAPGVYEALPGETLSQLVRRLGGLRPQAYVFGTEFDRVSVRVKQQENLDMLIRRMEQQQQSQMLYMAANRPLDNASQAALIQQQQVAGRAQIAALRTFKSNGRIALELNPDETTAAGLPDLPLEDGDRIVVPSTPGFVSTVGAVNNENVFIYKPGRTVGDVVQVAGLREEADTELMFVLRADGSIISHKDRSSFFGNNFDSMKLMPGDTIVIPEKLDRETTRNYLVRQFKDFTQILSQLGLGVAALKVLGDI